MSGWPSKRLAELCSIEIGRTPARDNPKYWDPDKQTENVWISIADMQKGTSTSIYASKEHLSDAGAAITPIVPEGALLLTFKLSIGKLAFAGRPLRTNEAIAALIPNDPRQINKNFLCWYLHSFDWVAAAKGSEKVKGATLNKAKLKEITVPVPSLDEQKRIVAILDEAFEWIDTAVVNAEKNLANARELFESYLNSVFAHKDAEWVEKKLEDTVQKSCSLSYGIVQPGEDVDDGLPIVRPTDLRSKVTRLDGLKRITPALADGYKRTELQGGELLLCVRGGTGSVSIAAEELVGSNVTRGIVPIRFDPKFVIQDFGYFVFISKNIQDQIRAATYGAALMQINIRDLRKVSLVLPPLDVQEKFLAVFNNISAEVERLSSIYAQKAAALVELKQSILKKAFAGNLNLQSVDVMPEAAE